MNPLQRTALVTGGARRLGSAIARDLARHGWAVAIHCNSSRNAADALAAEIVGSGGRAVVVVGDVTNLSDLPRLVHESETTLGKLSLLVNNASIFEEDAFGTLEPAAFERQMTVNFTAPIFLAQAFAAALGDREGNIVNMVDQRAWRTAPTYFTYQMSKSALWAATRVMAQALAPRIRVNAIAPGPVLPSVRQDAGDFGAQLRHLPLGHGPDPAEFGRTVRYLVENRSITGQMIGLDGGQHLVWDTPDMAEFDSPDER